MGKHTFLCVCVRERVRACVFERVCCRTIIYFFPPFSLFLEEKPLRRRPLLSSALHARACAHTRTDACVRVCQHVSYFIPHFSPARCVTPYARTSSLRFAILI